MDWMECELIESVEGKCGGRPVVKGTRVFAETVWEDFEAGSPIEEIQENWPTLSPEVIEGLIAFARAHEPVAR